jgi:hypothetical protein
MKISFPVCEIRPGDICGQASRLDVILWTVELKSGGNQARRFIFWALCSSSQVTLLGTDSSRWSATSWMACPIDLKGLPGPQTAILALGASLVAVTKSRPASS